MQDLENIKNVFDWFLNLEFSFCGVTIKLIYLFIFSLIILVVSVCLGGD